MFTDKQIREARMVSIQAHGNQTYDDIYPYKKHLDDVVDVLRRFGYAGKYLVAGYLHDIIEDTSLSYNKVKRTYGLEVAEMVYCVTDELGRDRNEKKAKTLPKTASNPDAIIIKLADRIANIEHGGKIDMYAKEFGQFIGALQLNTPKGAEGMWVHLEGLLNLKPVS
jgi:guanosine-3',5'-bis(diphosphate) 3'-pyrophosphohydrolase